MEHQYYSTEQNHSVLAGADHGHSNLAVPTIQLIQEEEARMAFLPRHFPRTFSRFEDALFQYASKTIRGYTSGYWEFAETAKGTPFLFPRIANEASLTVSNVFGDSDQELGPHAGGDPHHSAGGSAPDA